MTFSSRTVLAIWPPNQLILLAISVYDSQHGAVSGDIQRRLDLHSVTFSLCTDDTHKTNCKAVRRDVEKSLPMAGGLQTSQMCLRSNSIHCMPAIVSTSNDVVYHPAKTSQEKRIHARLPAFAPSAVLGPRSEAMHAHAVC